jgi:YD repeat-containing protein
MGSPTKTLQYRYDSRRNCSALIDHDGGRTSYTYDVMNRITQIINPQGDRTTYSYDAGGRRTVKKLANGTRASFIYDNANNLSTLANRTSTGAAISTFGYKYDNTGNRTCKAEK